MSDRVGLLQFYEGWPQYEQWLVEHISPLTSEQLAFTVAPNQRPVWLIAAHIIATRVGWFQYWLGEGESALSAYDRWDADGAPVRSAAELVEGLEATWTMIADCLERWIPDDLDKRFSRRGDTDGETESRGWIIWHVLEHDIHHGSELFLTLGTYGLPTPDM